MYIEESKKAYHDLVFRTFSKNDVNVFLQTEVSFLDEMNKLLFTKNKFKAIRLILGVGKERLIKD